MQLVLCVSCVRCTTARKQRSYRALPRLLHLAQLQSHSAQFLCLPLQLGSQCCDGSAELGNLSVTLATSGHCCSHGRRHSWRCGRCLCC